MGDATNKTSRIGFGSSTVMLVSTGALGEPRTYTTRKQDTRNNVDQNSGRSENMTPLLFAVHPFRL
jgi:hypothetical protein